MIPHSPLQRPADGRTDLIRELPDDQVATALPGCACYGAVTALRRLLNRGGGPGALGAQEPGRSVARIPGRHTDPGCYGDTRVSNRRFAGLSLRRPRR